jgi:hypothetical protein
VRAWRKESGTSSRSAESGVATLVPSSLGAVTIADTTMKAITTEAIAFADTGIAERQMRMGMSR